MMLKAFYFSGKTTKNMKREKLFGVNFSGGEKQKIAIARAVYKDAAFVIMDEPTAALDPESECKVYEGFNYKKDILSSESHIKS